jgi:hypothetical protein
MGAMGLERRRGELPIVERRGRAILWLLLVVGVLVTLGGVLNQAGAVPAGQRGSVVSSLLSTMGAGLIGAVLAILVAQYLEMSSVERLRDMLDGALLNDFRSSDTDVEQLRRPVHRYYATIVDGAYGWRAWIYHFEGSDGVGSLVTRVEQADEFGVTRRYRVEAGVRGTRLVIFGMRLGGHEGISVSVYPGLLGAFRQYHCGVSILQSFDSVDVITRTIISLEPLVETELGAMSDTEARRLDELWEKEFPRLTRDLLGGAGSTDPSD